MGNTESFYHSSLSDNLFLVQLIMVTTRDFEEQMPPTVISEEELMGLIQRRWQSRLRTIRIIRFLLGSIW
ncbi:hypothetical protein KY290_029746 [Solanum tuberosum]|uniref:Uncharacterized protein n=1 Tax=Solanum tuberosum TaxID=4113 RepID=A0ABQ7ULY3_SOLTU|nr:hypothetical protein KY289_028969 [Solanum tuberosum]KAH0663872.1 hypothetical protein KY284_028803 [Solanum tuberosum]KAH0667578.1 hypothetical protein KY285_028784 [Solanum tuberosum]KAH0750514.1 hypothetical protein KY290_029746 [Solanum tuberosum]